MSYLNLKLLVQALLSGIVISLISFEISPSIMKNIDIYIYTFMMIIGVSISIINEFFHYKKYPSEYLYIVSTGLLSGGLLLKSWEYTYLFAFMLIIIIVFDLMSKIINKKNPNNYLTLHKIITLIIIFILMILVGYQISSINSIMNLISGFTTGIILYYLSGKIVADNSSYIIFIASIFSSIIGLFIGIYILS